MSLITYLSEDSYNAYKIMGATLNEHHDYLLIIN